MCQRINAIRIRVVASQSNKGPHNNENEISSKIFQILNVRNTIYIWRKKSCSYIDAIYSNSVNGQHKKNKLY